MSDTHTLLFALFLLTLSRGVGAECHNSLIPHASATLGHLKEGRTTRDYPGYDTLLIIRELYSKLIAGPINPRGEVVLLGYCDSFIKMFPESEYLDEVRQIRENDKLKSMATLRQMRVLATCRDPESLFDGLWKLIENATTSDVLQVGSQDEVFFVFGFDLTILGNKCSRTDAWGRNYVAATTKVDCSVVLCSFGEDGNFLTGDDLAITVLRGESAVLMSPLIGRGSNLSVLWDFVNGPRDPGELLEYSQEKSTDCQDTMNK